MPEFPRPTKAWAPAKLQVWGIYPRSREVAARDSRTGERKRRTVRRFDVRYIVDGHEFRYGFGQRGWAEDFVKTLHEGHAKGWLFDPAARRFMPPKPEPGDQAEQEGRTFYAHTRDYVERKWLGWEPASRRNSQRDLARACVFLLREGAPDLHSTGRVEADDFLRRVALMVPKPPAMGESDEAWHAWFTEWSLPIRAISDQHLQAFIEDVRRQALDGTTRQLAETSVRRTRAVVRGAFSNALRRRLIDWDPWNGVEAEPLRDHEQVDPDLVMDLEEVRELANACGAVERRFEPFVLVQGFCGLRPGEAVELRRRDLDLRHADAAVLTVRGTHSEVPSRFFMEGETRQRPMKGRGARARRHVPLPAELVDQLRRHLDAIIATEPDTVVFTNASGGQLNLSNFHRDVWQEARVTVFAAGSPLRRVRRHDLRHSAITAWLNAGVPLKTVQAWSGHKTASVVLDTYLGVMKGDEALGRARFEAALRAANRPGSVTAP